MTRFTVPVATDPAYEVRIGPGALTELETLPALCSSPRRDGPRSVAVVTDARVLELHGAKLGRWRTAPLHVVPRGEDAKTAAELERVLEFLAASGLDRSGCVLAFGGGAVLDVAGLAASLFMRGVDVVHAPTTLLAQVDASVGGKTAINLGAGKNLAGTFHQPRAVLADTDVLTTLPRADLSAGLGEVLKTALLAGEAQLSDLEARADPLVAGDLEALAEATRAAVAYKAEVVIADERETGRRAELNLGHTFAHAIEHAAGFGRIPHGAAVGTGLCLALEAARELGRLDDDALPARVRALAARLGLATSLAELARTWDRPLGVEALVAGLAHDKKGRAREPALVLPRAAGRVDLGVEPGTAWCRAFLGRMATPD